MANRGDHDRKYNGCRRERRKRRQGEDAEFLDVDLWAVWSAIKVPVLAIRGAVSDLLLPETLERMKKEGSETYIVPDAGHAPALMDANSIAAIREFLLHD